MVHVEASATGPGPGSADRLEAHRERAFDVREADDAALAVADDGEFAHLCEGDEAAVRGVVAGDAVEQEDVAWRVQAGEIEVAQPPEV